MRQSEAPQDIFRLIDPYVGCSTDWLCYWFQGKWNRS